MEEVNGLEIAVIGIGCRFPGAANKNEYWELLNNGKNGISHFSKEELIKSGVSLSDIDNPNYVRAKGKLEQIEYFDADFFGYTEQEAVYLNPQHRIMLECAYDALLDGGYCENKSNFRIGVYASETMNLYMLELLKDPENLKNLSQIMSFNDKDYLATTISYKLNLFGQSVNVQCGCSSSLVAIHMACQALLSGDIDMGLAGGVTVNLPNKRGYLYLPDGKFSPDGYVRALTQDAQGYVNSDGAGVVLLKRYEDAIRDNDPIYCVIKSSFVNNDGNRKLNYSAPSEEGEYDAINNAFSISEIDPFTVSYIEMHATGTLIGDSIEIAAWSRYFQKYSKGIKYCAIGSVDTNIGHTDVASGVAKLIKTALMLHHKQLVKNLNYTKPNKNINIESSPFYIIDKSRQWDTKRGPLRAAVSSFGVGGTNAILLLEEADQEKNEYYDECQILPLSAHNLNSMKQLQNNMADYITTLHDTSSIYDIAYTYAKESKEFQEREFYVYSNKNNLIEYLKNNETHSELLDLSEHSIVCLFSGQGNQYLGLSSDLYKNLPAFRKYFDQCLDILKTEHNFNYFSYQSDEENVQDDFLFSQISIFIYQYSMFQTLLEFGIVPSLLIGHSLGEYAAACVSGVFSLKDAIFLVYHRAQLIQGTQDGNMMVVCKNEKEIRSYLSEQVSIAAVNDKFSVTVSGTSEAVDDLKHKLESETVACIEIGTKKAIHSSVMREITEEYLQILRTVKFNSPSRKWVSSIEPGLVGEEVKNLSYWIKNLCNTVRFYDGIQWIQKNSEKQLYLELGPGNALYSLLKTIQRKAICYPILQSRLAMKGIQTLFKKVKTGEYESFLNTIGLLWRGHVIDDISYIYKGKSVRKASMLPYPYDRKEYWYNQKYNDTTFTSKSRTHYVNASTREEKMISLIWQQVLNHKDFGIEDSFFSVGGNSLKIVKMQVLLEEKGFEIEVGTLYKLSTIKELVVYLHNNFDTTGIQHDTNELAVSKEKLNTEKRNYEGYNNFVYQNCFFNLLFAMLQANQISILTVLSNDILMYRLEDLIEVEYLSNMKIEDTLKDAGVTVIQEIKVDAIEIRLKGAIRENKNVITNIDCYKEKSRPATYMKKHVTTMLLIYDYNEADNTFSVIERKYLDTLSYQAKIMNASEIVECYKEFSKYFQQSDDELLPTYFEFEISDKYNSMNFKEKYSEYLKSNYDIVVERLADIMKFKNIYEDMLNDKARLKQKSEQLIVNVNAIINAKKVEKFKLNDINMYDNDEKITTLLDGIISHWEHIRNILAKFVYSDVYSKSLQKLVGFYELIYQKELDLINYIAGKSDKKLDSSI